MKMRPTSTAAFRLLSMLSMLSASFVVDFSTAASMSGRNTERWKSRMASMLEKTARRSCNGTTVSLTLPLDEVTGAAAAVK